MIELPTERSKALDYNPKLMIIFGKPKSGKSTLMASLEDNLIIDLEDGYRALSVLKVLVSSAIELFETKKALEAKMQKEGHKPYRFITIDNASRLEEIALYYAAHLYRNTAMGASWGYKQDSLGKNIIDPKTNKPIIDPTADVRKLPNGSGYLYMREAIKKLVYMFYPYCETLILVCHVKDKQIRKESEEMSEMSLDLAGKTGDIIAGEADAIGYLYREGKATYLSFDGGGNIIMEARPAHLRGKTFKVIEADKEGNLKVDTTTLFI